MSIIYQIRRRKYILDEETKPGRHVETFDLPSIGRYLPGDDRGSTIHDLTEAQNNRAAKQIKRCGSPPVSTFPTNERVDDSGWNRRRGGLGVESLAVVTALPKTPIPILLNYRSSRRDRRSDPGIVPPVPDPSASSALSGTHLRSLHRQYVWKSFPSQFLPIAEIIRRLNRSSDLCYPRLPEEPLRVC